MLIPPTQNPRRGELESLLTFGFLYTKCSTLKQLYQIHAPIFTENLSQNCFLPPKIVAFCAIKNSIDYTRPLFNKMLQPNVVENGYFLETLRLYKNMHSRDVGPNNFTFPFILRAYKFFVGTALIDMYSNCGRILSAHWVFDQMPQRNVVLETFREMLRLNAKPNNATLVIMLSASARLGVLEMGEWIFNYANNNGFKGKSLISNGLIDMYLKCGCIEKVVTWNVMIGGLAMHGHGLQALAIFRRMREERARLDGITFVGVLCACTHAGLVDEGSRNFHSMTHDYHNTPTIEHYGCMVDLLGRAGRIEEALELIKRMPIEVDSVVWSSLHGACRTFGNIEPTNPANYELLSKIFAAAGRRKEAARMKVVMIERGIQKIPGWSSIEVNGSVAKFYSSDKRNPRSIEIFEEFKWVNTVIENTIQSYIE
ncbi:hypothetical protein AMTRI_Chr02g254510 [Amborella trichopoda]